MVSKVTVLVLALTLLGCGIGKRSAVMASKGVERYQRADDSKVEFVGRWLFDRPLPGLSSVTHFVLDFQFIEDKASLILHSHFNGFDWRDGILIHLERNGERLHLGVTAPGLSEQIHDLPSEWIDEDGRMKLRIQVDNASSAGARVLLWRAEWSPQGEFLEPRKYISPSNADFDTEKEGWLLKNHGHGVRWGLELDHVQVNKAMREAPYVD